MQSTKKSKEKKNSCKSFRKRVRKFQQELIRAKKSNEPLKAGFLTKHQQILRSHANRKVQARLRKIERLSEHNRNLWEDVFDSPSFSMKEVWECHYELADKFQKEVEKLRAEMRNWLCLQVG